MNWEVRISVCIICSIWATIIFPEVCGDCFENYNSIELKDKSLTQNQKAFRQWIQKTNHTISPLSSLDCPHVRNRKSRGRLQCAHWRRTGFPERPWRRGCHFDSFSPCQCHQQRGHSLHLSWQASFNIFSKPLNFQDAALSPRTLGQEHAHTTREEQLKMIAQRGKYIPVSNFSSHTVSPFHSEPRDKEGKQAMTEDYLLIRSDHRLSSKQPIREQHWGAFKETRLHRSVALCQGRPPPPAHPVQTFC